MAIKKMEYTKGAELNVRAFPRIENKIISENIEELLKDEQQLIIKCGKSFWDVTQAPEIFEQADEFDPNELTSIERKEIEQYTERTPVHAYEEQATTPDPMNMLYQKTEEEEKEPEAFVRKTYYLTELVYEIIEVYRFVHRLEVSETVRELIMLGTPEDILEEAKRNLATHRERPNRSRRKIEKKR